MNLEEKREYAKNELGITQAFNMKEETLDKKIEEASKQPKFNIGKGGKALLSFFEIPEDTLKQIVEANGWDKVEYFDPKKAFKCYEGDKVVGLLDIHKINELNNLIGDK